MTEPRAFGVANSLGQRKMQEDFVVWTDDLLDQLGSHPALTVVSDGMGGHVAGEVASKLASTSFVTAYRREPRGSDTVLRESLEWANDQLAEHVANDPAAEGMGCTLVALEIERDGSAYRWLSVGDSILLSISPDSAVRLNADHSFRAERERMSQIGESLDGTPPPNVLRSAVMGTHIPMVDDHSAWRAFSTGEVLVIATDGLETLDTEQIARIVRERPDAVDAAEMLIEAVERVGKPRQDNTTVAVIRAPKSIDGAPPKSAAPPRSAAAASPKRWSPRSQMLLALGLMLGLVFGAGAMWGYLHYHAQADRPSSTGEGPARPAHPDPRLLADPPTPPPVAPRREDERDLRRAPPPRATNVTRPEPRHQPTARTTTPSAPPHAAQGRPAAAAPTPAPATTAPAATAPAARPPASAASVAPREAPAANSGENPAPSRAPTTSSGPPLVSPVVPARDRDRGRPPHASE